MRTASLLSLFSGLVLVPAARAQLACEATHVPSPNPQQFDRFGRAVAIHGDQVFIGAPDTEATTGSDVGAVHVLEPVSGGGWTIVQELRPSDLEAGGFFGHALALSGETLLVGAPDMCSVHVCGTGDGEPGAVYAFERVGGVWQEVQKILSPAPGQDGFGFSVAVQGDTALVGSPRTDIDEGEARILLRAGGTWTVQPPLPKAGPYFWYVGMRVALAGDHAVVVGYDDHNGLMFYQGVCLFYERVAGSWTQVDSYYAGSDDYCFGSGLALSPDFAVVGARCAEANDLYAAGRAFTFERDSEGWQLVQTLDPPSPTYSGRFGASAALLGDTVLIGESKADDAATDAGAVHAYERVDGILVHRQTITSIEPDDDAWFGWATALSPSFAVVGAHRQGTADVLTCTSGAGGSDFCRTEGYCETSPNSVGSGAKISTGGSLSVSDDAFVLWTQGLPPGQWGLYFYGPDRTQAPAGDGFLCVSGVSGRLPPLPISDQGTVLHQVDFYSPPHEQARITALSTWNFQFWYRDPVANGTGFNYSDAVAVSFCP